MSWGKTKLKFKRFIALVALSLIFLPFSGVSAALSLANTPTAGNITATSATISWTTNVNSTTLVKYRSASEGGYHYLYPATAGTMSTSHSLTLTALTPGTTYYYIAHSVSDYEVVDSPEQSFATVTATTPGSSAPTLAVSNLSGASGTATSASIKYTVDQYSIVYLYDNGEDYDEISNAQGSYNYTFNSLGVGTHTLGAKACNVSNSSLCSEIKTISYTVTAANATPSVTLTANPSTNVIAGKTVFLTGTLIGNSTFSQAEFKENYTSPVPDVVICKTTTKTSNNIYTCSWTPAKAGTYELVFRVNSDNALTATINYTVTAAPTVVTYNWGTPSAWGACANGTQTRTVSCTKTEGTSVSTVTDNYCLAAAKPATSQSCVSAYVTLAFSPTTASVGQKVVLGGNIIGDHTFTIAQFKVLKDGADTVLCETKTKSSNNAYACSWTPAKAGTYELVFRVNSDDALTATVNYTVTAAPAVITYNWGTPSAWSTCANGTQIRTVNCTKTEGATISNVADSYCLAANKPTTSQACTTNTTELRIYEEDIKALADNTNSNTHHIYWATNKKANCNVAYGKTSTLQNTSNTGNKISDFGALVQTGLSTNDGKYYYYKALTLTDELYYKIFCIDDSGVTEESAVYSFSSAKPDLISTKLEIRNLTHPNNDQWLMYDSLDIIIGFQNTGSVDSGSFYYTLNESDNTSGYRSNIPNLKAGENYEHKFIGAYDKNITTGQTLTYNLKVDSENNVDESNENNNVLAKTITVAALVSKTCADYESDSFFSSYLSSCKNSNYSYVCFSKDEKKFSSCNQSATGCGNTEISCPAKVIASPIIDNLKVDYINPTSAGLSWMTNGNYSCSFVYSEQSDLSHSTAIILPPDRQETIYTWYHGRKLDNLKNQTKYYYKVICTASKDNYTETSVYNFTTNEGSNTFEISGIQVSQVTDTTATITFNSNFGAKGAVWYGRTDTVEGRNSRAYDGGSYEAYQTMVLSKTHEIKLTNLIPNTTYYYRGDALITADQVAETASFSFKTLAVSNQYSWASGEWTVCANKNQTRVVECRDQANIKVLDSNCAGVKPAVSRACDVSNSEIGQRLAGRLLLAVEDRGRIYYIYPEDYKKYEVTFGNVMKLFQDLALGVSNSDLNKILINPNALSADKDSDGDGYNDKSEATYGYNPYLASNPANRGNDKVRVDTALSNRLIGRLLLQVEDHGRIWYVDQAAKRWEVTWENVMNLFTSLSLGITNEDLAKMEDGN